MEAIQDGITVTTASTLVVPDTRNQSIEAKSVILTNAGSVDCFCARGIAAELNKGIFIKANGGSISVTTNASLPIYAIVASGSTLLTYSVV